MLCNDYRRSIKDFFKLIAPVNGLLKKDQQTKFDTLLQGTLAAFHDLKFRLTTAPQLTLLRRSDQFMLETDDCNRPTGAVLLQQQPEDGFQPIGYFRKTLTQTQHNYDETERECLAIFWVVITLRPYLQT